MDKQYWIGVDLDRTLAIYRSGQFHREGHTFIGEPIKPMCDRIRKWLDEGMRVKIFTARLEDGVDCSKFIEEMDRFCMLEFGEVLEVTNKKDYLMDSFWDDRAVSVIPNTGMPVVLLWYQALEVMTKASQLLRGSRELQDINVESALSIMDTFAKDQTKIMEESEKYESA